MAYFISSIISADRAVATPEVKISLVRLLRVMNALISLSRASLASPTVATFLPVMAYRQGRE